MDTVTSLAEASTVNGQISKSELFSVYNKMRAEARRAGDTKRIERLNKALGILQSKNYFEGERLAYEPTAEICSCKDWEFQNAKRRAYTGPCKHMLAAQMYEAIVSRRAEYNVTGLLVRKSAAVAA